MPVKIKVCTRVSVTVLLLLLHASTFSKAVVYPAHPEIVDISAVSNEELDNVKGHESHNDAQNSFLDNIAIETAILSQVLSIAGASAIHVTAQKLSIIDEVLTPDLYRSEADFIELNST